MVVVCYASDAVHTRDFGVSQWYLNRDLLFDVEFLTIVSLLQTLHSYAPQETKMSRPRTFCALSNEGLFVSCTKAFAGT